MKNPIMIAMTALTMTALPMAVTAQTSATASSELKDAEGNAVGTAVLTQGSGGVLIDLKVQGLTPGKHGLHLHSMARCDADTGFKSADGHVGLIDGGHGLLNPDGPEPGDLPNIYVGADGTAEMQTFTTLVSLGDGPQNLLDEDGSSILIHEGPDDHESQPIGGSGSRIACGEIVPSAE